MAQQGFPGNFIMPDDNADFSYSNLIISRSAIEAAAEEFRGDSFNNEFSDPGGAREKHPGGSPNAGNLHGEEDHPKEREQENQRTLHNKDPRLGPCGPERILGGFGVVWGVILGAKWRPKWL